METRFSDQRTLILADKVSARKNIKRNTLTMLPVLLFLTAFGNAFAQPSGKAEYMDDCARCHGVDGKGSVASMREVRGYMSVDLTRLSKAHDGRFPRQEVYDAIAGRERYPAHFAGSMPTWGLKYQDRDRESTEGEVRRRISALVSYIESLQEK
ncbi:MAG: cytochrome c [Candidatus Binatus sp.]|uniref:c-type cytochrome n=1 Tax=Candidatus Binatus sp. TaxID=2811406 RepID=UPI00271B4F40|nr:cytochrome c [Candidatus Binatus sp.]MDO8431019.1 cytochrome c [Candidatus Binatus sp.]